MTDSRVKRRRLRQGLCVNCGVVRGVNDTPTMCRACANKKINKARLAKNHVRTADGLIFLRCENCFREFQWTGSGQRVFCDACVPWFNPGRDVSAVNHEEEQEHANRVKATSAQSIILSWMRQ